MLCHSNVRDRRGEVNRCLILILQRSKIFVASLDRDYDSNNSDHAASDTKFRSKLGTRENPDRQRTK